MKSAMKALARLAGLVATPLTPAHYLGLVRPLAGPSLHARVESVEVAARDVTTLTLRPGHGWAGHRPGQHVRVGVEIDGRIATRTHSLSSAADDELLAITVKAQGRVSNALTRLRPGSYLALGQAEGDFVLPEGGRHLFVSGGSGLTPFISMLRTFARQPVMPDLVHVHYARTAEDVICAEELSALGHRLHLVLTAHDRRRFSRERLDELVPDWQTRTAWACGPAPLLVAAAFTNPRIERFTAALAPAPDASGGRVRFHASRISAISDGRTPLLRIAEDAGVTAPHGCRMGICHTCDATLTAGCVRDLRTGQRIDEPGARIQICVCAAAGDVELAL